MQRWMRNQSGMTMVEVMIAAGLLGGLAIAGATLFKNQDKAQKTVESNFEVATTVSQIRGVLSDITNCSASLGGQNINGGSATFIKKSGVNVYPVNTNLPGNIQIKSYKLSTAFPVGILAPNETMLQITFGRAKSALQMDVVRSMKVVYTGGPTITSCYAYVNNSDSYWQLAGNGSDIYYVGGKVGIGTPTPTTSLDVTTGIANTTIMSGNCTSAGFCQSILQVGTVVAAFGADTVAPDGGASGAGSFFGSNSNHPLFFRTNSLSRVTIDVNGRVGIGTPSPTVALDVVGPNASQTVGRFNNSSTDTRISLENTSAAGNAWSMLSSGTGSGNPAGSFSLQNTTSNVTALTTLSNGYVGLGTVSPNYLLHLQSSTFSPYITLNNSGGANKRAAIMFASGGTPQFEMGVDGGPVGTRDFYIFDNVSAAHRLRILPGGNVGIGTITPGYKLEVAGDIYASNLRTSGSGGWISDFGGGWYMSDATWIRSGGGKNVYHDVGIMRTDGTLQVGGAGATMSVASAGAFSLNTTSFTVTSPGFNIDATGRSGIGMAINASYFMDLNGSIRATGFVYNSDRRLKKDIETVTNPLDKITSMRGVSFNWIKDGTKDIGVIAQEVEKVEPALVSTDSKGFKSVKYGNIIGIVIEAIKELKTMIMNLINDQDEIKAEQQKMWDEIKTLREENRQLRQDLQEKKKMELRK